MHFVGLVLGLPNCDFDQRTDHWCDWVQALDDEYQWKARQYPTFAINTGPQADHTTGSKYMSFPIQQTEQRVVQKHIPLKK